MELVLRSVEIGSNFLKLFQGLVTNNFSDTSLDVEVRCVPSIIVTVYKNIGILVIFSFQKIVLSLYKNFVNVKCKSVL